MFSYLPTPVRLKIQHCCGANDSSTAAVHPKLPATAAGRRLTAAGASPRSICPPFFFWPSEVITDTLKCQSGAFTWKQRRASALWFDRRSRRRRLAVVLTFVLGFFFFPVQKHAIQRSQIHNAVYRCENTYSWNVATLLRPYFTRYCHIYPLNDV